MIRNMIRKMLLVFCLLLLALPADAEETEPAPKVRIWLKRLAMTDRADLTLDAAYTMDLGNGTRIYLEEGVELTLILRGEHIMIFCNGMNIQAGTKLNFVRNSEAAGEERGLRFSPKGNVYPGDLSLKAEGGQLVPVLTLSVEDYLLGVVPYEMSDTFPLEALKAQAVCARTYALSHLKPDKPYDMSDTPDDQVFYGINEENWNAARAVRETAGVVGTIKGQLATCFYAASNGGQTELPQNVWGGTWEGYAVTDDPYDVENPESITLKKKISKNSPDLPEDFLSLLAEKLTKPLSKAGMKPESCVLRVDQISAMSLGKPRYGAQSRLYTELTLTFTASAAKKQMVYTTARPDGLVQPPQYSLSEYVSLGEQKVTISLFPQAVRALKLSVYGADNELITLEEEANAFVLYARRYGHGIGMSQRGAQQMAGAHGMDFVQILSFYYPGMELARTAYGLQPPVTPDPQLAATPGPAATPTPRPTLMPVTMQVPEGGWLARVEGIEPDSSLNLREEPNSAATILRRLYYGQKLMVVPDCTEESWVHVKTDAMEGYVKEEFLVRVEAAAFTPTPMPAATAQPDDGKPNG